jgi:hypothetical protein
LQATFPASDPISITLHKPSNGIDHEPPDTSKAAGPLEVEANWPPQLAGLWEANLWPFWQFANLYAWWFRTLRGEG